MRAALGCVLATAAACTGALETRSADEVRAALRRDGTLTDVALGEGRVVYLGFVAEPQPAQPGGTVRLAHYWQVRAPLEGSYAVFVHVLVEGARGWVEHGDHRPAPPTDAWRPGDLVRTEHELRLPAKVPGERLELRLGLYRGKERLGVDDPALDDGEGRVRAGFIPVAGAPLPRPRYLAPRLTQPPRLDGHIDEDEWAAAPWTAPFLRSRGDGPGLHPVRARLGWDEGHLYVAIDAEDPDVLATLSGRDAPIYTEEAHELFIDADGDGKSYVELQVSPAGVLFDCAFAGGPRQRPRRQFDATFAAATFVDGTLNDASRRDRGWRSEWRIDTASLPDAGDGPRPGACWRINLFHLGKERDAQGRPGPADESAWSAPLMGDLHNLERFGELCFSGARP